MELVYVWPSLKDSDALGLIHTLFSLSILQALLTIFQSGIRLPENTPASFSLLETIESKCRLANKLRVFEETELWKFVKGMTIPFLRRATIWFASLSKSSTLYQKLTESEVDLWVDFTLEEEYTHLLTLLKFENQEWKDLLSHPALESWLLDFVSSAESLSLPPLPLAKPFQFIPLISDFHQLLNDYMNRKCLKCQIVQETPGLCLVCGTLLCMNRPCCREGNEPEALMVD